MKEALLKFIESEEFLKIISWILNLAVGIFAVQKTLALSKLKKRADETPNKFDDLLVKFLSDLVKESSGLDSGNVAIKGIIENISTELKNNAKKNVEEVVKVEIKEKIESELKEKLGKEINLVTDVLTSNIEKKIHSADNGMGNTFYTDNFKVTEIINSEKDLLKKDVNGYITAYAEAQGFANDTEKFAQGIIGIAATKTF